MNNNNNSNTSYNHSSSNSNAKQMDARNEWNDTIKFWPHWRVRFCISSNFLRPPNPAVLNNFPTICLKNISKIGWSLRSGEQTCYQYTCNVFCLADKQVPCGWEFNRSRRRGWESWPLSRFCGRVCFNGVLDIIAPLLRGWASQAVCNKAVEDSHLCLDAT